MKRALLSMLALTLVVVACSDQMTPAQPDTEPQMATVPVSVAAAPAISTLTITVSASDITTDLVFNVTMTNGEATDTITIPAGSNRTITVRGFDSNGIETHRGSKMVTLTEGLNAQLTVVLSSLSGDQPLVVALGETTVAVSPETATLSMGGTTQLTAVVTDEAGDTLDVSVRWATSNPAFASVDATGLVSGVSTGSASIIATFGGVGASAAITVSESEFPSAGLVAWYPFNGNANDESGNGHHALVEVSTYGVDRFGVSNAALDRDGVSTGEAITPDSLTNLGQAEYSVALWFNPGFVSGSGQWTNSVVNTSPHTGVGFGFNHNTTPNLNYGLGDGQTFWKVIYGRGVRTDFVAGQWYHVVITKAGTAFTAYIDGVQDWTYDLPEAATFDQPVAWRFGQIGPVNELFLGVLDDVGIWNRALTPEEIAYLANN